MKRAVVLIGALLFFGCASSMDHVRQDDEKKPLARYEDPLLIFNQPDEEIVEIQTAYARSNYDWLKTKLKGYFEAGSQQFVADIIHDSPGMSLRMLSVAILYHDRALFDDLFPLAMANETDENCKRYVVAMKRAFYVDCESAVLSQTMRTYLTTRRVRDIDFDTIKVKKCQQAVKQIF